MLENLKSWIAGLETKRYVKENVEFKKKITDIICAFQKWELFESTGGNYSSIAGCPDALSLLQDLYDKSYEQRSCLLSALGNLQGGEVLGVDSVSLAFGHLINTARRITEVLVHVIPIDKLKRAVQDTAKIERALRADFERSGDVSLISSKARTAVR